MKFLAALVFTLSLNLNASEQLSILINTDILDHLNISYPKNENSDLALIPVSKDQLEHISHHSHDFNRCGGYELIDSKEKQTALQQLTTEIYNSNLEMMHINPQSNTTSYKSYIYEATQNLLAENLEETVAELSQFKTRSSRGKTPNKHVLFMKEKVDKIINNSKLTITSELIPHQRTRQKTLKVRIEGHERPQEIIVLGGHLDSTAYFSDAPGADDNASGSANILEVLRVLSQQAQPQRSIEFFWYAAEEVGLVGSAEIAKSYKALNKEVIAVMQLDMTGFAGSGLLNIGNITDYTSPWLQQLLVDLNNHYVKAVVHSSKCGYGCSDHASWFRQGYNTVFPIEAKFKEANKSIHTQRDTINKLNFEHSLAFAKLALTFSMELSNSEARNPILD